MAAGAEGQHVSEHCPNCNTLLVGLYCHACGQHRLDGRLTVHMFWDDVRRRIFRFDKAFALTFWGMLRAPGQLVTDYLEGRRESRLDPLHFFVSSIFTQFVIAWLTRWVAPLVGRESALGWLERVGGVVAVKILIIFWMASIWRLILRGGRFNLAETYVFATYAFATTGLLWAAVLVVDLIVPVPLGANGLTVLAVTFAIELAYLTYAVAQFTRLSWPGSFARVFLVLVVGYGILVGLAGPDRLAMLLRPSTPVLTW